MNEISQLEVPTQIKNPEPVQKVAWKSAKVLN